MISKMEKRSIAERHEELRRSDYNSQNEYSRQHPDAQSNGDVRGRGYGTGAGHTDWAPNNADSAINVISPRNFDTDPEMNIGTSGHPQGWDDVTARNKAYSKQLYSGLNPYPLGGSIDTTANILEGQIIVNQH